METRNQSNSEFRQATQDALARHDAQFQRMFAELQGIQTSLQTLTDRVINVSDSTFGTNRDHRGGNRTYDNNPPRPYLKLIFPRFNGEDPIGWLYQAEQYFDFQQVAADDQVQLASFHLDGIALQWHRWLTKFCGPLAWAEFSQALLNRFGPTDYDNPSEALHRLQQLTTVSAYQEAFERMSNQVDGLPEAFLVGCFIGGLKDEIRLEVKLKNPRQLAKAIGVARLVEEKLSLHHLGSLSPWTPGVNPVSRNTSSPGLLGPGPTSRFPNPTTNSVRRLSSTDARERREKGLCYYCDDRYLPGHKCSTPQLFMITDVLDSAVDEPKDDVHSLEPTVRPPEISFRVNPSMSQPPTLRPS